MRILRCIVTTLLIGVSPTFAVAQAPKGDVAIITLASGQVSLQPVGEPSMVPKPFSRVRLEDRLRLATGSQLRIVYLQSGRAEFWSGPADFRAGNGASDAETGSPEVSTFPTGVRNRIARAPELVARSNTGGVTIRGVSVTSLKEIRETYLSLLKSVPDGDITPELFLMAATAEYAQANRNGEPR